jgi:hypothetical protein
MTAVPKSFPPRSEEIDRIADAINGLSQPEIERMGAWQPLADLSSNTLFDGIDTSLDSVVLRDDGTFEAVADIYVGLHYGGKDDAVSLGDSYPATIRGRIADERVDINSVEIDTGSFYE